MENVTSKTIEIGSIMICTDDKIIRILINVWYVLVINKNVISFDTLDFINCKYFGEDGVMRICKDSLITMKCKYINDTYVL